MEREALVSRNDKAFSTWGDGEKDQEKSGTKRNGDRRELSSKDGAHTVLRFQLSLCCLCL